MKKRFLSTLMALCLALSLLPTAAFAAEDTGEPCDGANCTHVAEIGEKHYATLQAAVNAVETNQAEATTITLLDQSSFSGVKVDGQNIVIDFGGGTYTVGEPTVGSTGTETNGFQLLKGSKVTMRNGTLKASDYYNLKLLIQNYCDLTLDSMILDAREAPQCQYVASNNCGNILISDSTIYAADSQKAFDVFFWPPSYAEGVSVTVENSTINGPIECTEQSGISEEGKNTLVIRENTTL